MRGNQHEAMVPPSGTFGKSLRVRFGLIYPQGSDGLADIAWDGSPLNF